MCRSLQGRSQQLPVVSSGSVLVEDTLLYSVSLSESIVDITQLISSGHLVTWAQWVCLSQGHGSLLERVWLSAHDVSSGVRCHVFSALSGMEAADSLGGGLATQDVHGFERGSLEIFILSCRRQRIRKAAGYLSNLSNTTIFFPMDICWLQWVS